MKISSFLPRGGSPLQNITLVALTIAASFVFPAVSSASLLGTVPTPSGSTVFPGLVPTGTSAGTLLAIQVDPYSFTTSAGTTSGTVTSAVYKEAGGTLDFYYQVFNNASSATAIARETDGSFGSFATATGYRLDGGSLVGTTFVNGVAPPVTADRNGAGSVVGFSFNPPDSAKILPGIASDVLVVSTDAKLYTIGFVSVIDGGTQTVNSYQPTGAVPEPASFGLFGGGLLLVAAIRKAFKRS